MSLCPFCGAPLPAGSRFCPRCGAALAEMTPPAAPEPPAFGIRQNGGPVSAESALVPAEPAPEPRPPMAPGNSPALRDLRMHLHQESKAWRFFAIGILVMMMACAGLFLWIGGLAGFELSSWPNSDPTSGYFALGFSAIWGGVMTLTLLPVVIVGFVMGSKVLRYYEEAATDCTNALKHAGSVGVIVLAVIFSTPALVFIIINFVKTKRNRAELEAVQAAQKAKRPPLPRG